ncbi:MAG TPA: hypothetical protein PK916_14285 [Bacteroidota bacterium]|nr:hypothetical protein [Bacteroidota bacterium]
MTRSEHCAVTAVPTNTVLLRGGAYRALRLPAFTPGVYFLRVTSPESGRTGQFTVK